MTDAFRQDTPDGASGCGDDGQGGGSFERTSFDGTVLERLLRPPVAAAHDLRPHPEGGWYRRTWATSVTVLLDGGGPDGGGPGGGSRRERPTATSVLFALPAGESSAWHTVASDEVWFWHGPGTVVLQLGGTGAAPVVAHEVVLGPDVAAGQQLQVLVEGGQWQRTRPAPHDAVVSCVVSPGFDVADFSLER